MPLILVSGVPTCFEVVGGYYLQCDFLRVTTAVKSVYTGEMEYWVMHPIHVHLSAKSFFALLQLSKTSQMNASFESQKGGRKRQTLRKNKLPVRCLALSYL